MDARQYLCHIGLFDCRKNTGEESLSKPQLPKLEGAESQVDSRAVSDDRNKKGENQEKIYVINDQFGCPTYSKDLVDCTMNIIVSNKLNYYKVYNFSNEGYTNWYDFTKKIFELKKINCPIIAVSSDKYKSVANRPKYCITDKSRIKDIFNITIRKWDEALEEFIINYK